MGGARGCVNFPADFFRCRYKRSSTPRCSEDPSKIMNERNLVLNIGVVLMPERPWEGCFGSVELQGRLSSDRSEAPREMIGPRFLAILAHSSLHSSILRVTLSLLQLLLCSCFIMGSSKSRKEAKNAKKEEAKQALVAKLAENFGRSVRPSSRRHLSQKIVRSA